MDCFACSRVCCQEPDAHKYSVKNEETSVVRKKKNPGGLGCLRIATNHQCVTALTNTQRGVRASSPFQDGGTALGFSSLPPCCWKPSQELLLWDSTMRSYVLLANNLLASSSWYSVIVQWLFICFIPVCTFIGTHKPHSWKQRQPTCLLGERHWCRALPSALWDKFRSLGPWQQTAPWFSHRHLRADPAPASWRGPGYFKASPAGLMQHGSISHTVGSQLSHGTCGSCGDALAMPASSRHHPTPSLSSQLHSFSAYQKGSLELPLLCLWMCLCLEANQKHSRSGAQLRID